MLLAALPINVWMRRFPATHRWGEARWGLAGIAAPYPGEHASALLHGPGQSNDYACVRLQLELHPDENDGYFENWVAPQPKVFVMWHLCEGRAVPQLASVSYAEGTRMLDSGDEADGFPMPAAVFRWLAVYLTNHHRPRQPGHSGRRTVR